MTFGNASNKQATSKQQASSKQAASKQPATASKPERKWPACAMLQGWPRMAMCMLGPAAGAGWLRSGRSAAPRRCGRPSSSSNGHVSLQLHYGLSTGVAAVGRGCAPPAGGSPRRRAAAATCGTGSRGRRPPCRRRRTPARTTLQHLE